MSRTGARDKARRQLTETLEVLGECAYLLGRSRKLVEHLDNPEVAQYLKNLDVFFTRPFLGHGDQKLINETVDTLDLSMNTNKARYSYLGEPRLDAIVEIGQFVGKTPENTVLHLKDLDCATDLTLARELGL